MTLNEFLGNIDDLKDETVLAKFNSVLDELRKLGENNGGDYVRDLINAGLFESMAVLEQEDVFGTEGMRL